jgi:hypothetical protein
MSRAKTWAFLALLLFMALPLPAQDAGELEALLDSPALTWGEAARLVLAAAGREGLSETDAFAVIQGMAKLPRNAKTGEKINLGGFPLLS